MTFSWTQHRFAGGALAFDVANTVVMRHDPEQRIDRFAQDGELAAFSDAASRLCAERSLFGTLHPLPTPRRAAFLFLRERIDAHFRHLVDGGSDDWRLAVLLEAIAGVLKQASPHNLDHATAHSVLRLVCSPEPERIKICRNCGWLFLDRSKNRSRTWCDMSVCGNRVKAGRHYRRKREDHA